MSRIVLIIIHGMKALCSASNLGRKTRLSFRMIDTGEVLFLFWQMIYIEVRCPNEKVHKRATKIEKMLPYRDLNLHEA